MSNEKHDRIKQQIRGLKRGRLLVLENLPVPEDYRGLKTDDLLDWFEETEWLWEVAPRPEEQD